MFLAGRSPSPPLGGTVAKMGHCPFGGTLGRERGRPSLVPVDWVDGRVGFYGQESRGLSNLFSILFFALRKSPQQTVARKNYLFRISSLGGVANLLPPRKGKGRVKRFWHE